MRLWLTISVLIPLVVFSQQGKADSVMTYSEFMEMVESNHPLSRAAWVQEEKGQAELTMARGGFDPTLESSVRQKQFENKRYYSVVNAGVRIPIWFGLEAYAGYDNNNGQFLNPENAVPSAGLWSTGLSLSLGEGLFIDKRMAALRKARAMAEMGVANRKLMLNELYMDAGRAYWKWYGHYHRLQLWDSAVTVAQTRLEAVKRSAVLGDRPYIDTLEAGIQLQSRQMEWQQAMLDLNNSTALLNTFLWGEGYVPMELTEGTIPPTFSAESSVSIPIHAALEPDTLISSHPMVDYYESSLSRLEVERRWKREQLKPTLKLKFNAIAGHSSEASQTGFNIGNYTWGLEFQMPLVLWNERGQLRKAELDLKQTQLEFNTKRANLEYYLISTRNRVETLTQQYDLTQRNTRDYRALWEGEKKLFAQGESSLFMLNSRELKYIEAFLKNIDTRTKLETASVEWTYSTGQGFE